MANGDDWVHRLHTGTVSATAAGIADVDPARSRPVRMLGWLMRLPPPAAGQAARLRIVRRAEGAAVRERWIRTFGTVSLSAAVPPSSRCGRTEARSRLRIPVRALARKPAASGSSVRATGIPKRALCEDGPAPGCITGNVPVSTYRGLDSYLGSADSLAREATTTRGLDSYLGSAERWTQTQTGVSHWRTLSKDNVTTLYGTDATCRVADPFDQARTFCRVQRLLFFSDFPSEPTAGPDCLVRSLDFAGILQSLCDGA